MSLFAFIATTFSDNLRLINPANIEQVLGQTKTENLNFLRIYLALIGVPLFLGYFFFLSSFKYNPYSVENSLKLAFMYYVIAISLPMIIAYVLYLFDERLVRRKVAYPEALTLFTSTLGLSILSGFLRVSSETWLLHILAITYGLYLTYTGLDLRYGKERSVITPYLFLMLVAIFSAALLLIILKAVLMIPWNYY